MTDLPTDAPADVEHEPIDLTAELVAVPTTDLTAAHADPAGDAAGGSSSALPVLATSRAVDLVAVPDRHPVAVDGELYAVAGSRPAWKSMAGPLIGVALVSLGLGFLMARGAGDGGLNVSARTITTPPRPTTTVKVRAVASSLAGGTSTQSGATATSVGGAAGAAGASSTDGASSSSSGVNVAGATATNGSTASSNSSSSTGSASSSSATSSASSSSTSATSSAATTTGTTQAAATTAPTTAATTVPTTPATEATTVPTTPAPTTAAPTTTLSPGARYRAAVLAAGPQGYWSLDETNSGQATDASGKGRTGSFSGGVSGGQAGAGAGTAVSFNGSDGAMTVADANALRLNGAFSIEMWVKLDAFTHTWPGLLAKGSASSANGYLIYFKPDGRMVFKRNNVEAATSPGALTSGFNHFVVTYDGGTVRWYVNGALQTTKAATFPTNNGTDAFVVGRGDEYGTMTVDELAVYPSALDGGTIQSHYNALR